MVVGPLREFGRTILLAQIAILGVRHEPRLRLVEELLEAGRRQHLAAFLAVQYVEVFCLGVVDAFVVDLRQGVELLAQGFKPFALFLVTDCGQGVKVGVLRMQREDAYAAVRIRVGPGVRGGGVVDGQQLQHALLCQGNPVDHLLQVAEVAHTEAAP